MDADKLAEIRAALLEAQSRAAGVDDPLIKRQWLDLARTWKLLLGEAQAEPPDNPTPKPVTPRKVA